MLTTEPWVVSFYKNISVTRVYLLFSCFSLGVYILNILYVLSSAWIKWTKCWKHCFLTLCVGINEFCLVRNYTIITFSILPHCRFSLFNTVWRTLLRTGRFVSLVLKAYEYKKMYKTNYYDISKRRNNKCTSWVLIALHWLSFIPNYTRN